MYSRRKLENALKSTLLENVPNVTEERIEKILESLSLQGIESWSEQQQQSAKSLIKEYQHLFAFELEQVG